MKTAQEYDQVAAEGWAWLAAQYWEAGEVPTFRALYRRWREAWGR